MQENLAIIVLAAGKGSRMPGDEAKVLTKVYGTPLIDYVLDSCTNLKPNKLIVVTGYMREAVEAHINSWWAQNSSKLEGVDLSYAYQEQQLGTGDAARVACSALNEFSGNIIITYGDIPLVKPDTFKSLVKTHSDSQATLSLVSIKGEYSNWYGRIIRDAELNIQKVVERKDCSPTEMLIDETNSGIYMVDSAFLKPAVENLKNDNAQKEYYLTDIVERAASEGQKVEALVHFDADELRGINTVTELKQVEQKLMTERINKFAESGVIFKDPNSVFLDAKVKIGGNSVIGPQVVLLGNTEIGERVNFEGCALIKDTKIGADSKILWATRIEESEMGENCAIGPFAHMRPETKLGDNVRFGNFVESKKSLLKNGVKAPHLSYLGNATVGENANVGAGTITCNYDGANKHATEIGSSAFIGSNTALVAPIKIGSGATIGAGSTITKDVSDDALALTRANQKEVSGWAKKRKDK